MYIAITKLKGYLYSPAMKLPSVSYGFYIY